MGNQDGWKFRDEFGRLLVVRPAADVPREGHGRMRADAWSVQNLLDHTEDPWVLSTLLEIYEHLYNEPHSLGAPTLFRTSLGIDNLCRSLERAIDDGRLVVVSQEAEHAETPTTELVSQAPAQPQPQPQPQTQAPSTPPPKPEQHTFSICFVDEVDQPIASVALELRHADATERRTTDSSGMARVDKSSGTTATARVSDLESLRNALKTRWSEAREEPWLDESSGCTILPLFGDKLPKIDLYAEGLRTLSVQPFVARARLIGGFFDTSKCFVLPSGLEGVRGIVRMAGDYPGAKILLVGHTDTSGQPGYNDPLSLERAEALKDCLVQNVDGWLKWYKSSVSQDKRWGGVEDCDMILALPDAFSRDKSETPVRWFQRTRGLEVDGIAGDKTRGALVKEYMALEDTSLPEDIEVTTHGCGENFPEETTGDGVVDENNRRVEAYFFDGKLGVLPPPPGANSKAGSKEYPEWRRRAKRTEDFQHDADVWIEIELLEDNGKPREAEAFRVVFSDGGVREGTLDAKGQARIQGRKAGQCKVSFPNYGGS